MTIPGKRPAATRKQRAKPGRSNPPDVCTVPNCSRRSYARGLCQTHHRQLLTTGELKPIRPYRKRSTGTVKFSGLRLSPACVEALEAYAEERGLSHGAAIAEIIEDWHARRAK